LAESETIAGVGLHKDIVYTDISWMATNIKIYCSAAAEALTHQIGLIDWLLAWLFFLSTQFIRL